MPRDLTSEVAALAALIKRSDEIIASAAKLKLAAEELGRKATKNSERFKLKEASQKPKC